MAAKRRGGLGARDLDVLLGTPEDDSAAPDGELQQLRLDRIQPGKFQPRQAMDPEQHFFRRNRNPAAVSFVVQCVASRMRAADVLEHFHQCGGFTCVQGNALADRFGLRMD